MVEFPRGWTKARVADIFESCGGGTPHRGTSRFWSGKIPWLSSGDIKSDRIETSSEFITRAGLENSTSRLCRPGALVVVVRSGILKHTLPVAVLAKEAAINQDIKCFDSRNDLLNRWLLLALKARAREILAQNREGTTVQSVKYSTLLDFELPIPPLSEQRRITAKLEELLGKVDACQERLKRLPLSLRRFRQSVLTAACSGRLTGAGGEADGLPPGWEVVKLGTLFRVATGATPSKTNPRYFKGGKIPWVRTADVQNGDIREVEGRITERAIQETNAKVFPANTLLIAMYGEGRTRGQVARLCIPAATNQACAALINEQMDEDTRQYIFYCLLGNYHQLRAEAVGGNQPNLSLGIVREWTVPMPPKDERGQVVQRVKMLLKLADRIESRYGAAKISTDQLTQSILAKAFRGELVPQDPKEEPATALLKEMGSAQKNSGSRERRGAAVQ